MRKFLIFKLSFKLPNADSKFDRFISKKKSKSSLPQGSASQSSSRPFNRRSSFIESQTKLTSCSEQFINLVRSVIREEIGASSDLNRSLDKLLTRDVNNNDQRIVSTSLDRLVKPENAVDLNAYLLNLIAATQSALDKVCNESSNQIRDSCFDFTSTGSNFGRTLSSFSPNSSTRSVGDRANPTKSEPPDERDYLSALDKEKLLVYKEQLEQTIRKLSGDLVGELEVKDSIYLRRDELFMRIEHLTRQW